MITQIPLSELYQSRHDEIATQNWIERERVDFEIGRDRALIDWYDRQFNGWVLEQQRIDEVLGKQAREFTSNVIKLRGEL